MWLFPVHWCYSLLRASRSELLYQTMSNFVLTILSLNLAIGGTAVETIVRLSQK